ncbi:MAG TPA: hypothetical protein VK633_13010, partial [Verrucomicrobiae bacterium]|nr:hypothetical protein [Verrucomicrobiae bacterium]
LFCSHSSVRDGSSARSRAGDERNVFRPSVSHIQALKMRLLTFLLLMVALCAAEPPDNGKARALPLAETSGLHNLFRLGPNLYSGSAPEGSPGFAELRHLGIKTIITVDGTKPDVATAKTFGLRYVHLPHGYEGISASIQLKLIQAAETLPGPFYIHCHHGFHRGPAAAAILCMAQEGWTTAQAEEWLKTAGTATHYAGLYRAVREFRNPTAEQLLSVTAEFHEIADVPALVDLMVGIDARWDNLKEFRARGYESSEQHPDFEPANEAVLLWEHFREAQRLPGATERGQDFIAQLKTAEAKSKEAEGLLRQLESTTVLASRDGRDPHPNLRAQLDQAFDVLHKNCASCHETYRDLSPPDSQ